MSERLDHSGRWFVDDRGRVVILHGVNIVNKFAPYTLSSMGFGDDDAAILAAEGFNAVRVGVIYSAVEPRPGKYNDFYLDDVSDTVATLHRHGILSLLDFHQDLYGLVFNAEGFPEWATFTDGLPTGPNHGQHDDYVTVPAVAKAFDNFWNNRNGPGRIGVQDRYAAAWAHVASRFESKPGVLGYELINEPFPGSMWGDCSPVGCGDFDQRYLGPFYEKVISAIREKDKNTLAFIEPNIRFSVDSSATRLPKLNDSRVGFAFHPYIATAEEVGMAEQYATFADTALLASEWGATTDPAIIRAKASVLDDGMMSWTYWTWANQTPPKIPGTKSGEAKPPNGSEHQGIVHDLTEPRTAPNVSEDRLGALSRAYPRAVAGTPKQFSFDAKNRTFTMSYWPRAVSGKSLPKEAETEVFLPTRHYPRGYEARVTGGTVVSPPGDNRLRVTSDGAASLVTVQVTPA
jgi:endoglycosylceramidase